MTTMVANATRVAAVAEDATRLLGLRSPGERSADVTATKRRHAQLSPGRVGKPVRNQVLSTAVDPGAGAGAGNPLTALLDQPGFVAPGLVGTAPSGVGGGDDVAVTDLPPPSFTPGGVVFVGGGGSTGGSAGGSSGGGSTSTGGTTATGGTTSTSTGGDTTTSTGGTSTTSTGGTASSGGESNVPAVPEPSTWLMMLAGFAAIGMAMRRTVRHSPVRGA